MVEQIEYGEDYIKIYDKKGEIAYWNIEEWKENENVVFSICKGVELASKNKLRETL